MKNRCTWFVAAVVVCFFAKEGLAGSPKDECDNCSGWCNLEDGTLRVRGEIPKCDDYPWDKNLVRTVVIEDGVTSITEGAFANLPNLVNVTLPKSVVSIERFAFQQCGSLVNVIVSNSSESVGNARGFSKESVVKEIGMSAFDSCSNLKNVMIPEGVTLIRMNAFYKCNGLTSIVIPASVEFIAGKAFYSCENLVSVFYLGSNHISEKEVFSDCDNLSNICVSSVYQYDSFGGKPTSPKSSLCQLFYNRCFIPKNIDGNLVAEKLESATEWEKQTNGCVVYECNNETGPKVWNVCNESVEEDGQKCIEGKCIIGGNATDAEYTIEFEIEDGVRVTEWNRTQVYDALNLYYGIDADALRIGMESDEQGNIIRVTVFTDDKATAETMQSIAQTCSKKQREVLMDVLL